MDPIKHVVLLVLENHSFDRVLGCFTEKYPDLEGVSPSGEKRFNVDSSGRQYFQAPTTARQVFPDPRHEVDNVAKQLADHNSGFVLNYEKESGSSTTIEQRQEIMGYYPREFLPALHKLASDFTICDHWFASVPGPTWTNRFFALTGTSSGKVRMPNGPKDPDLAGFFNQTQDTIFDRLDEAGRSWRVYYYDIPCSLILKHQQHPRQLARYRNIRYFFDEDVRIEKTFPEFVLIEPKYSGADQNDDHPPHNVIKGDKLVGDVFNALRSYDDLWNSTLLIIAFDEHGGFYDHVEPPEAEPPRPFQPGDEYEFNRYGVRVPAVLVSPWVGERVEHTLFDHTSVLKYLIDKWGLGPLGNRTAQANSIGVALQGTFRPNTLAYVRVPYTDLIPEKPELEQEYAGTHQEALKALSYFLGKELDVLKTEELDVLVRDAGQVEQIKAWFGAKLTKWGRYFSKGAEEHVDNQAQLVQQAIDRVIARGRRS